MQLEKVVPFGRSFDEYVKMFNLTEIELNKRILGVGDGPASFNAEASNKGYQVTSLDPLYQFNGQEIYQRFESVVDNIIQQVKNTPNDWVWSYHKSPEDLCNNRRQTIKKFIQDYELGKNEGRYILGQLPKLNLPNSSYDLALCSHFLFLYSEHYDLDFHMQSIEEMLRVSREVRIFPLLTLTLQPSSYLEVIIEKLTNKGFWVSIETVEYQLQRGGNQMLRIK